MKSFNSGDVFGGKSSIAVPFATLNIIEYFILYNVWENFNCEMLYDNHLT